MLKRQGCACSDAAKAVEVGKELWDERLEQAWPDRRHAGLGGGSDDLERVQTAVDGRVALLNALEDKAMPDTMHDTIGPTARRAASNGGYRPQCPDEPVEGLPAQCPSPSALARLAKDLGIDGKREMMEAEASADDVSADWYEEGGDDQAGPE